ncbi:MAG: 6-phosphogluconolactonase, partial [Patescibacteria group bacterium]
MVLSDYFFEERQGLLLLSLKKPQDCEEAAKKLIYANTDGKTALFLSGGSTPKRLYEIFAEDGSLSVGAVGMVDERYGKKWHEPSNEKM